MIKAFLLGTYTLATINVAADMRSQAILPKMQPEAREIHLFLGSITSRALVDDLLQTRVFQFKNTEQQDEVTNSLRTIARNPVGKDLLYRIFIEIYGRFKTANPVKPITIEIGNNWAFDGSQDRITIDPTGQYDFSPLPAQGQTPPQRDTTDIYLFRQLLSWFRSLQQQEIKEEEQSSSFWDHSLTNELFSPDLMALSVMDTNNSKLPKETLMGIYKSNVEREWQEANDEATQTKLKLIFGTLEPDSKRDGFEISVNAYRLAAGYGLRIYRKNSQDTDRVYYSNGLNILTESVDLMIRDNAYRIAENSLTLIKAPSTIFRSDQG